MSPKKFTTVRDLLVHALPLCCTVQEVGQELRLEYSEYTAPHASCCPNWRTVWCGLQVPAVEQTYAVFRSCTQQCQDLYAALWYAFGVVLLLGKMAPFACPTAAEQHQ